MAIMELAWLIILLPLASAVVCAGMALAKIQKGAHWVAILPLAGSTVISLLIGKEFLANPALKFSSVAWPWINLGQNWALFSIQLDGLSALMLAVVTTVSLLVVIYSRGYMSNDPGYSRFFAQMSLFVAAMCTLVLAGNFLMLYLGWEGVGLCSFMLIGFWYRRPAAAAAAVKAFIVTRIGDTGFALGVLLLFLIFGSLDYTEVFQQAVTLSPPVVTVIALLLLAGAVGKSAQLPLYVWLPDAMEGPTPTSALIHAATMVTAGVYLIARCGPIFLASPIAFNVVALVGGITAFYAATIAIAQFDIKRILAYSTISQIGYMFLAIGILAPAAGMFHLATHAFFKALLFCGAGVIMHAMGGVIDIRQIGGLKKLLPVTYWTFLIAALALSGIFPFAGFWSKDEIILAAWYRWPVLGILAWITGMLTTLYIFRIFFRVFHGPEMLPPELNGRPHAIDRWMKGPLLVLALGSIALGFILGWPPHHGLVDKILHPSLAWSTVFDLPFRQALPWILINEFSQLIAIVAAWKMYGRQKVREPLLPGGVFTLLNRKYYVDELYDRTAVESAYGLAEGCSESDDTLLDGILAQIAAIPHALGKIFRTAQNGALQVYALGVIVLLTLMLLVIGWRK
jgi:NADH-quinone oxidoreductase subunit L